jgi:hypothetical protein
MRNRIHWHLGDLLVGILALVLIATAGLSADLRARETQNRVKCASNLRQLGQGLLMYANENKGDYPRTVSSSDQNPKPVWGTPYEADNTLGAVKGADPFADELSAVSKYRPAPDDVTAAFFLLLRTEDITTGVFVCPSSDVKAWNFGRKESSQSWTNWSGNDTLAKHLSYSYQNPYPSAAAIAAGFKLNNSIAADFAVASDMNPGGDAILNATLTMPGEGMRKANSLNHAQDGQLVLFGDGHVEFENSPFCGVQRDNIYTANGPEVAGEKERTGKPAIAASPVSTSDSILLPTAADIGAQLP